MDYIDHFFSGIVSKWFGFRRLWFIIALSPRLSESWSRRKRGSAIFRRPGLCVILKLKSLRNCIYPTSRRFNNLVVINISRLRWSEKNFTGTAVSIVKWCHTFRHSIMLSKSLLYIVILCANVDARYLVSKILYWAIIWYLASARFLLYFD